MCDRKKVYCSFCGNNIRITFGEIIKCEGCNSFISLHFIEDANDDMFYRQNVIEVRCRTNDEGTLGDD